MATRKTLDDLLREESDSALLDVKAKTSAQSTEQQRALAAFEEINTFVDRMGFAPGGGGEGRKIGIAERMLQTRLKTYQDDPKMAQALSGADRHGLLLPQDAGTTVPTSMDELLSLDDPLLTDPHAELFELRHARAPSAKPDMVSERKPCEDFERFKPLFDAVAAQLVTGERKSMKFANEQEIEAGGFFILGGLMVYVAEVRDPHIRNGKRNARLRLIFENGTEGANLLRSLATELYKDPNGRRISDPYAGPLFGPAPTTLEHVPSGIERHMGNIYVVKSLSTLPQIARLEGQLFKIGFTTGTVEERLRSAAEDPTFLMAPVHPVLTYSAINLNPNKFENLVHRFFAQARLDIEITDRFGKPVRPREWFLLPLPIIEQAIPMILDGSIVQHRYNHRTCAIEQAP